MKRLLIIFLISITLSCNNTQSTYKPLSSGRIHSLSVVVDAKEWNSKIGDEIRKVYADEYLGLPQVEERFSLSHIDYETFSGFARTSRNIIYINKRNKQGHSVIKNKYARPQVFLEISGLNEAEIIKQIKSSKDEGIKAFAKGEASREELLKAEISSYHGEGTCTFYGTANSNQMLMEIMGLHLPGAAFIHPHSDLRNAFNVAATQQAILISRKGQDIRSIGKIIDERSFVNAIIGLLATGGSTNHTLHLPAMAAAAGIKLLWEDFEDLSKIIPLLAKVYPNGSADINQFHAAGGMSFIIGELLDEGLLDGSAKTIWGENLFDYISEATLKDAKLIWNKEKSKSYDDNILRTVKDPHQKNGGLKILKGNLGKGVIKISAVKPEHYNITAPAMVFDNQEDVKIAYNKGILNRDVIVVVKFQGPKANGMPELHALTPILSNIQDMGFKVALITDGRMSGASGKVPSAIHITPEAIDGGIIAKIQDGDEIEIDASNGKINVNENISKRKITTSEKNTNLNFGRNLFSLLRSNATGAENGAGLNLINN